MLRDVSYTQTTRACICQRSSLAARRQRSSRDKRNSTIAPKRFASYIYHSAGGAATDHPPADVPGTACGVYGVYDAQQPATNTGRRRRPLYASACAAPPQPPNMPPFSSCPLARHATSAVTSRFQRAVLRCHVCPLLWARVRAAALPRLVFFVVPWRKTRQRHSTKPPLALYRCAVITRR